MKKLIPLLFLVAYADTVLLGEENRLNMAKSLEEYIREARAAQSPLQTSGGSLYSGAAVNAELFTDIKARRVNDIVTIRILESTEAQSAADAQTNRSSSFSVGFPKMAGLENHVGSLDNLFAGKSSANFKGDGSTNRSGSVDALLSARVKEVLPNGDMVIEGVKEIKVNNERQLLRLFGVVRSKDIGPGNVVYSTAIANMFVQIDGHGVLSDNIKRGWLMDIISKAWPF
ncbi:MAG TPA: flagellar basal body L-ring protein FlgH [Terriglobia bacterium]|nr:flagellar basal body L-ring protein FlgH [Terriglobia bacterium]